MNKYFLRINWGCIFYTSLLLYGIYKVIDIYKLIDSLIILVIIEITIAYFIIAFFFNLVYFYNNKIVQKFPLRILYKERIHLISNINKIKYNMPINYNIESIVLYKNNGETNYIRIDSKGRINNKEIFLMYYKQGIELDFVDTKHHKFEELEW